MHDLHDLQTWCVRRSRSTSSLEPGGGSSIRGSVGAANEKWRFRRDLGLLMPGRLAILRIVIHFDPACYKEEGLIHLPYLSQFGATVSSLSKKHMRLSGALYTIFKNSIKPTARIMSKDSYSLDQVVKDAQGKMQYVNLGPSGLRVSKISLGMMS